tara:strand:+ start:1293 stop:1661 length:369 start_codon:yes stop_codon:yes gene_type:complete
MITAIMIIDQDPTGSIKIGTKFEKSEVTPDEMEFMSEFQMILEAYAKESGKLMDGGLILQQDETVVAENPIPAVKVILKHFEHSGKTWEELEPYLIEQIAGITFRHATNKEMDKYKHLIKED